MRRYSLYLPWTAVWEQAGSSLLHSAARLGAEWGEHRGKAPSPLPTLDSAWLEEEAESSGGCSLHSWTSSGGGGSSTAQPLAPSPRQEVPRLGKRQGAAAAASGRGRHPGLCVKPSTHSPNQGPQSGEWVGSSELLLCSALSLREQRGGSRGATSPTPHSSTPAGEAGRDHSSLPTTPRSLLWPGLLPQ